MNAKIFICHHPSLVVMYKNFAQIIRKNRPDEKIILFKVNHPYFLKFNFKPFERYFDEIIEFDFIHYRENFLSEWWRMHKFVKKIKQIGNDLFAGFENVSVVTENSAWLPVNMLLKSLEKNEKVKKITRIIVYGKEKCNLREARFRTLACNFYCIFFPAFKIKMLKDIKGSFADFVYDEQLPGKTIRIRGFFDRHMEGSIPYPVIQSPAASSKNRIIVFGDAAIPKNSDTVNLKSFFLALENRYKDCALYYKPHPADNGKIMPGINIKKYNLLGNDLNAQTLIDDWGPSLKAVYSASSSSLIFTAFSGIPSYSFYKLFLSSDQKRIIDEIFASDYLKSDFLFHMQNVNETGKIDDLNWAGDIEKGHEIILNTL